MRINVINDRGAHLLLVIFLIAPLVSGCAATARSPVTGGLYTEVDAPLTATSNVAEGELEVGKASATSVLGLVATGDASIQAAMENGGVTEIYYVDYNTRSILGLYAEYTVTVYGQ